MTPELWQRLKELYDAVLDTPEEERDLFIAAACGGNSELKRELIALVEANTSSQDLLPPLFRIGDLFSVRDRVFADGQLIQGRFKVVRHLGTGGMGEVYEAIDLQLGRIALKTIRPTVAATEGQLLRFKKEVQLARKVSSPYVCRMHELHLGRSGPDGNEVAFLTMEFLEGSTLTERVRESGPLPWREAQQVALEICAALQSIHEAGIVHRDLKGRNIMLASRNGNACAVLMDFGIAREVGRYPQNAPTALTQDGAILGTPDYMAPEQFEGKEASRATDIYALGIILCELVSGKLPVKSGKSQPTLSSIQPGVPRRLDHIITKCLRYEPRLRYQSAKEVKEALQYSRLILHIRRRPLLSAAGLASLMLVLISLLFVPAIGERLRGIFLSSSEKHIAILPLDVVGGSQENQALGDGLMDSLAGKLSNLDIGNKALWVVPASEVRSRSINSPSLALRELGATIVVKGSFERQLQVMRLKLTLIDPKKAREIGFVEVESLDGDAVSLEDDAVTRLARLMNISIGDNVTHSGVRSTTHAAYEDYLAGLGYFQRHDKPGNLNYAISALQSAIKTDPDFALAFALLSKVFIMKYRLESNPQWLKTATAYAQKASELNDSIPSTYVALGQIHEFTGNHDLAIQEFQRAVALDPRDAEAITGMATSYKNAGRNSDAAEAYIKAAALRPNDWTGYNNLGIFYESIGRPREAIVEFNRALELTPDNAWPYANLGMAYMDLDDPKMLIKAEEMLKKSISINPTFGAYGNLGYLYAEQHRFPESITASRAALKLNDKSNEIWVNLAMAYEWMGKGGQATVARRKAMQILETTVKMNPQYAEAQATLAALSAKEGLKDKALEGINISLALSPSNQYVLSQVADAYELLGDREKAIRYLQQALEQGMSRGQLNEDPEIRGLVHDPRFTMPGI